MPYSSKLVAPAQNPLAPARAPNDSKTGYAVSLILRPSACAFLCLPLFYRYVDVLTAVVCRMRIRDQVSAHRIVPHKAQDVGRRKRCEKGAADSALK
jgi:hypothetical protein